MWGNLSSVNKLTYIAKLHVYEDLLFFFIMFVVGSTTPVNLLLTALANVLASNIAVVSVELI